MFCPLCNPEYKNAEGKMVRKDPNRHLTTNFKGGDGKVYLKCTFCGYSELDPDAKQPPDDLKAKEAFLIAEKHDALVIAHDAEQKAHADALQQLKATQSELVKAKAKIAEFQPVQTGIAPGGWTQPPAPANHPALTAMIPAPGPVVDTGSPNVLAGAYPHLMHDPSTVPQRPDLLVHNADEEQKARLGGYTVAWPAPPAPVSIGTAGVLLGNNPTPLGRPLAPPVATGDYPKLLRDPSTVPHRPDLLVNNSAEEDKARADHYTVVLPNPPRPTPAFPAPAPHPAIPVPTELPPAHSSVPGTTGWEKPENHTS